MNNIYSGQQGNGMSNWQIFNKLSFSEDFQYLIIDPAGEYPNNPSGILVLSFRTSKAPRMNQKGFYLGIPGKSQSYPPVRNITQNRG